ncbi:envelope stress response membrane protein PspC [Enterobacterales bacterium CwR94]|nr:envelope stress response membrane protein PspC [Enterobacterales bacterium CwR94]
MIKNKLYLDRENGKFKGVCAGLATYLGVPVRLMRVIVVLSMFFGLFVFTLVAYFALAYLLDDKPYSDNDTENPLSAQELLLQVRSDLGQEEKQVREMERYVTSDAFSVRSRFRQL